MKKLVGISLAAAFVAGISLPFPAAQEEPCRLLDPESGRRFLPDRVPMETESIQVDNKNYSAIQFSNKNRTAVAVLLNTGLPAEMRQKYQYVLISEARLRLDHWNLPAGMLGLSLQSVQEQNAPTRVLVVRNFDGSEIDRVIMKLDPNAADVPVSLVPKDGSTFELRIGKYSIQGTQR